MRRMECQEEGLSLIGLGTFVLENLGRRMLKEYRMQVGRASVKLEFSENAESGLRDRVKMMLEKSFQNRIEKELVKFEAGHKRECG